MSPPFVFITGATGFIGSHVVSQALTAGYNVRLSVRKEAQINTLSKLFSEHAAQLDFTVIPDLASPDAFTKALEGVTYVFHLASPMPGKGVDFEKDYLEPAIQGTIALLNTAKNLPTIKRVVIVSSLLALIPLDGLATGNFVAKEGLNPSIPIDPKMTFPTDPSTSSGLKYHASKVLAHRATLDWAATNTPLFHIITLHPSFVFGRNLLQTHAADLDGTNAFLWASLAAPKPLFPMASVDVRDVAGAHIKALDLELGVRETGRVEEFLLSAGQAEGWTWAQVKDFVVKTYPRVVDVKLEGPFPEPPKVDASKARDVLGVRWKGMQDTLGAFLDQQMELQSQL